MSPPRIVIGAHKWYELPPLNGRCLIDTETGEEVRVHRLKDDTPTHGGSAPGERGSDTGPFLDIPF